MKRLPAAAWVLVLVGAMTLAGSAAVIWLSVTHGFTPLGG